MRNILVSGGPNEMIYCVPRLTENSMSDKSIYSGFFEFWMILKNFLIGQSLIIYLLSQKCFLWRLRRELNSHCNLIVCQGSLVIWFLKNQNSLLWFHWFSFFSKRHTIWPPVHPGSLTVSLWVSLWSLSHTMEHFIGMFHEEFWRFDVWWCQSVIVLSF